MICAGLLMSGAVPVLLASPVVPGESVIGRWKLTAALDSAHISSLDDREAQQLIGSVVAITREQLRFREQKCAVANVEAQQVEPRLFLHQHYHADSSALSLPNPVTLVHLGCTSAFIKNRNRLVIFWDGWFFEAVRVKR